MTTLLSPIHFLPSHPFLFLSGSYLEAAKYLKFIFTSLVRHDNGLYGRGYALCQGFPLILTKKVDADLVYPTLRQKKSFDVAIANSGHRTRGGRYELGLLALQLDKCIAAR